MKSPENLGFEETVNLVNRLGPTREGQEELVRVASELTDASDLVEAIMQGCTTYVRFVRKTRRISKMKPLDPIELIAEERKNWNELPPAGQKSPRRSSPAV